VTKERFVIYGCGIGWTGKPDRDWQTTDYVADSREEAVTIARHLFTYGDPAFVRSDGTTSTGCPRPIHPDCEVSVASFLAGEVHNVQLRDEPKEANRAYWVQVDRHRTLENLPLKK
jgi:hypothetical protein